MKCIELFSGAGGLAKGLENVGFNAVQFVEFNKHACNSLRENFDPQIVFEGDIRDFKFPEFGEIALVAGGPPCQPFSLGGNHRANEDKRDMFPFAAATVAKYKPKTFVFENVKGLLRMSFTKYFEYILLRLTYPTVLSSENEHWVKHSERLNDICYDSFSGVKYKLSFQLINAANYGVPQKRERVFIVGVRSDLGVKWDFPAPTHCKEMLDEQKRNGVYWEKHKLPQPSEWNDSIFEKQGNLFHISRLKRWNTVRDALQFVPDPRQHTNIVGHDFRDGARQYPGHTGSYIDEPAKTIKAGDHGVPGGENMIRFEDGTVRYFTAYEAKLIQTFGEDFVITGSWGEALRQLGNAVPTQLSEIIGHQLYSVLSSVGTEDKLKQRAN